MSNSSPASSVQPKKPNTDWRWPRYKRICYWLLSRGVFSRPLYIVSAGIFYELFVKRDEVQIGNIWVSVGTPGLGVIITGVAIAAAIAFIGSLVASRERRSVQRARDRKAIAILEAAASENRPRYFLYLRPFILTKQMTLKNPRHGAWPMLVNYYTEDEKIDLETMLERGLRKEGPLVALGRPGEMVGAGRLAVPEEEWKSRFEVLARSAERIFVIPSQTSGTQWEIAWLRDHACLYKCVFIMPPKLSRGVDAENFWKQAASATADSGISLPAYSRSGLLFTIDATGAVVKQEKIGNGSRLRANLAKLIRSTF